MLPLGFSPDVITSYFPGINLFTDTFKILSLFILIIIVLWSLSKNIFGDISFSEKDNSFILIFRSAIAIVLILWSLSAMSYIFNVFTQPFYALTDNENNLKAFDVIEDNANVFGDTVEDAFMNFIESANKTSENTYDSIIDQVNDWLFPGVSILQALVQLICIAVLGYKFILFILEILERYFILMVQTFTSPLIWSTIASKSTIGIFKRWLEIFISNFILIYLDMWLLGIIVKAMSFVFNPEIQGDFEPNLILGVCAVYVMIRIAQSLDNYIARLITTATAGNGLGAEIFMTFKMFQNSAGKLFRNSTRVVNNAISESSKSSDIRSEFKNDRYPGNDFNFGGIGTGPKIPDSPLGGGAYNNINAKNNSQTRVNNISNYSSENFNKPQLSENKVNYDPVDSSTISSWKLSNGNQFALSSEDLNKSAFNEALNIAGIPKNMDFRNFLDHTGIDNDSLINSLGDKTYNPTLISRRDDGSVNVLDDNNRILGKMYPVVNDGVNAEYKGFKKVADKNNNQYLVIPNLNYLEPSLPNLNTLTSKTAIYPQQLENMNSMIRQANYTSGLNQTPVKQITSPPISVDLKEKAKQPERIRIRNLNNSKLIDKAQRSDVIKTSDTNLSKSIPITLESKQKSLNLESPKAGFEIPLNTNTYETISIGENQDEKF